MNIYALIRELSGPRPLRRVPDICRKPRIWNRKARAVSFETPQRMGLLGLGRTTTQPPSGSPNPRAISMLQLLILPAYVTRRAADVDE